MAQDVAASKSVLESMGAVQCSLPKFMPYSDLVAAAARVELLQQRAAAAEEVAAHAAATASTLRVEAGCLGTANGKLNTDCETLRGRLAEAKPALASAQAQLQVRQVQELYRYWNILERWSTAGIGANAV